MLLDISQNHTQIWSLRIFSFSVFLCHDHERVHWRKGNWCPPFSHLGLRIAILSPSAGCPWSKEEHAHCAKNPVAIWVLDSGKKSNDRNWSGGRREGALWHDHRKWVTVQVATASSNISAWFCSNTQCSATCGKGTRMRYVSCREEDGSVADESACTALPRPLAEEECVGTPCGRWKALDWSPVSEGIWALGED